ncbi:MAG: ribonuclease R family protein [Alphaproteobacteria bacterium]
MPRNRKPSPRQRHKGKHKGGPRQQRHGLPPVAVLDITGSTEDGELTAIPVKREDNKKPPHIIVTHPKDAKKGDRVLASIKCIKPHFYAAQVIRVLPGEQPQEILGMFVATASGGIIEPVSRKMKQNFFVPREHMGGAEHGEMVRAMTLSSDTTLRMPTAKIEERLGSLNSPRAASLIATHMHELPTVFSQAALAEAEAAEEPTLKGEPKRSQQTSPALGAPHAKGSRLSRGQSENTPTPTLPPQGGGNMRVDLRNIPLVTIDGEDARDFDDAVFAEKDGNGFRLIVAIADVAHYVSDGGALDGAAFERGNSVYFPDRVIPMLPERLSNGLCSLVPHQDRYCLAVHIWIDKDGNRKRYQFVRGIMRSHHRFTYEELQTAQQTQTHKHYASIIKPLYEAYAALCIERDQREPLALNLPEFKIRFDEAGNVAAINPRQQLESHRLIESFMIAANVAAADLLLQKNQPAVYRVHEHPDEEKLEELRQFVKQAGYSLQKGAIAARQLNQILKKSSGKPEAFMVHTAVLRAQMQAYYSPDCMGHFGLSLNKYCHFTSPIRRYSDLVVHRGIVGLLEGHKSNAKGLATVAEHISNTERKAMLAERDASDRYKVSYMQRHIGDSFPGQISGMNQHGLFITINSTGVTGFIPIRNLPGDFYAYDKKRAQFKGRRMGRIFHIGQTISIEVQEANSLTGSLIFALAERPTNVHTPHQQIKNRTKRQKRVNKKQRIKR